MKHMYIHIPFCKKICSYCDFCKMFYNHEFIDKYLDELNNEIIIKKVKYLCTNRKYLTFFWKIFHYNYPTGKVRYRKQRDTK